MAETGPGPEPAAEDTLDQLTSLVDKSLVVVDAKGWEAWYRLLETVRQYASDRLNETGDGAVSSDNAKLVPGFCYWIGRLACGRGDTERATALLDEGLAVCRERGDTWWACQLLAERGEVARSQGNYARAAELYQEGLNLSRATGGINNSHVVSPQPCRRGVARGSPATGCGLLQREPRPVTTMTRGTGGGRLRVPPLSRLSLLTSSLVLCVALLPASARVTSTRWRCESWGRPCPLRRRASIWSG